MCPANVSSERILQSSSHTALIYMVRCGKLFSPSHFRLPWFSLYHDVHRRSALKHIFHCRRGARKQFPFSSFFRLAGKLFPPTPHSWITVAFCTSRGRRNAFLCRLHKLGALQCVRKARNVGAPVGQAFHCRRKALFNRTAACSIWKRPHNAGLDYASSRPYPEKAFTYVTPR